MIPVAQIQIIGIGLRWILETLHHVEVLRVVHIQGVQHNRVQDAENHRIHPNPECKGQDRCHREAPGSP